MPLRKRASARISASGSCVSASYRARASADRLAIFASSAAANRSVAERPARVSWADTGTAADARHSAASADAPRSFIPSINAGSLAPGHRRADHLHRAGRLRNAGLQREAAADLLRIGAVEARRDLAED